MSDPEEVLADSPADFDSSLAYALHPEMRRLLIVWAIGWLLTPIGLSMFLQARLFTGFLSAAGILQALIGLVLAIIGAALFFGGLIGALFKLVVDANLVAGDQRD
jgi:hypothetical protein